MSGAPAAAATPSETAGTPGESKKEPKLSIWQKPISNVEFYGVITVLLLIYAWGMLQPPPTCRLGEAKKGCPPKATASRITVSSGRAIAYREWGVPKDDARHTILALHGTFECRHQGLPGVSENLLRKFGVRMVSYDRPGTAQSDAMNAWSLSYHIEMDMVAIKRELDLAEPFWILAIDSGAPYAFHAAWHKPEWLAGIALLGPSGPIPAYPGMSDEEVMQIMSKLPRPYYIPYTIASQHELLARKLLPVYFHHLVVFLATTIPKALEVGCSARDLATLHDAVVSRAMQERMAEALGQNNGHPLGMEFLVQATPWDFNLSDFSSAAPVGRGVQTGEGGVQMEGAMGDEAALCQSTGEGSQCALAHDRSSVPIHIWHGTEDTYAPIVLSQYLKRTLGDRIQLHELEDHGHFSYFYSCDECHHEILETMLGTPKGPLHSPYIDPEDTELQQYKDDHPSSSSSQGTKEKEVEFSVRPDERVRQCILEGRPSCDFGFALKGEPLEGDEDDGDGETDGF